MKKLVALLLFVFVIVLAPQGYAQSDSIVHVKTFPGNDVGTKIGNAMATCPAAPVPCILLVDASLATMSAGNTPSLCRNCFLQDWRGGPPASYTSNQPVNVLEFGADNTGVADSSAAIKAAAAATCFLKGYGRGLYFPPGIYSLHEVDLSAYANCVFLKGDMKGGVIIQYDGDGAQGSYLFKIGAISQGGWQGIQFMASTKTRPPTAVAENILIITGQLDDTSVCRDDQFAGSWGDAIVAAGGLVNFHCDNVRFDGIGGHAFSIQGFAQQESRPLTLTRWTLDNTVTAYESTLLRSKGIYDGKHWGQSLFYLNNCVGVDLTIGPGRIESNQPWVEVNAPHHDEATLVYEDNTKGNCNITIDGAGGFGSAAGQEPLVSIATASSARVVVNFGNNYHNSAVVKERDNQTYYGRGTDYYGIFVYDGPFGIDQNGWSINGQKQDVSASPAGRFDWWPLGGVLWHTPSTIAPGQKGIGSYAITPNDANCLARPSASPISKTAIVESGSANVTGMGPTNTYLPGDCIEIAGAGPSGANLETYIKAVDFDTQSLTMAANATTSVNPAIVKWDAPQWREFGFDATRMTQAPTTGTWSKGEVVWNGNPASGSAIGWVCTAAGTPGTWVPFGLATTSTVPVVSGSPKPGAGVCWKSPTTLGTCSAGTWPNCSVCN